jgi:hypothetical protein
MDVRRDNPKMVVMCTENAILIYVQLGRKVYSEYYFNVSRKDTR